MPQPPRLCIITAFFVAVLSVLAFAEPPPASTTVERADGQYVRGGSVLTIGIQTAERFGDDYAAAPGGVLVLQCPDRSVTPGVDLRAVRRTYVESFRKVKAAGCPFVAFDIEADYSPEQWAAVAYCIYSAAEEAGLLWGNYEDTPILATDAASIPVYFGGAPTGRGKETPAPVLLSAVSLHPGSAAGPNAGKFQINTAAKRLARQISAMQAVRRASPGKPIAFWYGTMMHADPGEPHPNSTPAYPRWTRAPATREEMREAMRHGHLLTGNVVGDLLFNQRPTGGSDAADLTADYDKTRAELAAIVGNKKWIRAIPGTPDVLASRTLDVAEYDGGLIVGRMTWADARTKPDTAATGLGKSFTFPPPAKGELGSWAVAK